jgi:hypothetical protein
MGKSVVVSNLLSRAKAFWGWFIRKSPAFIVLTSLTVVSVFGLGVGGTLAATGVIPNPFADQEPEGDETLTSSSEEQGQQEEFYPWNYENSDRAPWETKWDGTKFVSGTGEWLESSSWTSFGSPDYITYRWSTTELHVAYSGPCPANNEIVYTHYNMPNYGNLSARTKASFGHGFSNQVVNEPGLFIGGFLGGFYSFGGPEGSCNGGWHHSFGQYKCFNFNEVWIDIMGPTAVRGFYKLRIPEVVPKKDCMPGAEQNDPAKFLGELGTDVYEKLRDYPEAVITPPAFNVPPKIEWGPYVPSTPSPTPTAEISPTPSSETSTTPTTPTTPTPEPSPTPTSP